MKYVYATLLLNEANREINQDNVVDVLNAAGVDVTLSRVKALVAALEGVDIDAIDPATDHEGGTTSAAPEAADQDAAVSDAAAAEGRWGDPSAAASVGDTSATGTGGVGAGGVEEAAADAIQSADLPELTAGDDGGAGPDDTRDEMGEEWPQEDWQESEVVEWAIAGDDDTAETEEYGPFAVDDGETGTGDDESDDTTDDGD